MVIKTYTAPDLATALAKARSELGPDALVLATTEKNGRLGLSLVEVTVGAKRDGPEPRAEADDTIERLSREVEALRRRLESPSASDGRRTDDREAAPPARGKVRAPALRAAVDALSASGLSPDLAERFARIAARDLAPRPDARTLAEATAAAMEALVRFGSIPQESRCVFVVGPPGSGKTTTVAKLASRFAARERKVVFAEADGDRIGAMEQAEIYSRYIGAVPARIDDEEDLRFVLNDAGEDGVVVVDTPGIGARDGDRAEALLGLRQSVPEAAVAVLVPAGLHRGEAGSVLQRFAALRPTCAAFTRIDDADRLGELVTALSPTEIPLAFYTNGHDVPDDLVIASPRGLAALLLRAGPEHREKSP